MSDNIPEGISVIGELEADELDLLSRLNQQHKDAVYQLGLATLQQFQCLQHVAGLEQKSQQCLSSVGARFDLSEGSQWSVTQDGKVIQHEAAASDPEQ